MKGIIAQVYAWLTEWQTLPSAAEQINAVLGTFEGMVVKLDAAIEQATDEVSASFDRTEDAYAAFLAISDREEDLREEIMDAKSRAVTARARIAALTGGAA